MRTTILQCGLLILPFFPIRRVISASISRQDNVTDHLVRVLREDPPHAFGIRPSYKRGGHLVAKYDAWRAMTHCVGQLGLMNWEDPQPNVKCPDTLGADDPDVGIDLTGNNKPGQSPLLTKHAIWSIPRTAEWWESTQPPTYAETNFPIFLDLTRGEKLGFGRLYKRPTFVSATTGTQRRSSTTEKGLKLSNTAVAGPANKSIGFQSAVGTSKTELRIFFSVKGPAVCTAIQFYIVLMDYMTFLAEMDQEESFEGQNFYSPKADFSFELSPTSEQAGEEGRLKMHMAIAALRGLADFMANVDPKMRFWGFRGNFKYEGPVVGKVSMYKGTTMPTEVVEASDVE